MSYADLTTGDPNRVKRWLHRRRFADAFHGIKTVREGDRLKVLDLGAGDGELAAHAAALPGVEVSVYEPVPRQMAEARAKLASLPSPVTLVDALDTLASGTFDYVFCLEVFEHLPSSETLSTIGEIDRLLKDGGAAVVGVPHELFLPALFKGAFRMGRRFGEFDARPANVLAAALGRPPRARPVADISPGRPYHFHHLGFDYRALERRLRERFLLSEKWFSPFPVLGAVLNSEVYFVFRKSSLNPP